MKNSTDVSKKVMEKIIRLEEGSALRWRRKYFLILIILSGILAGGIYFIIRNLLELQTFALLSLFGEDREIVTEYWRDTLATAWEESPHELIFLGFFMCAMIVLYVSFTRRKRFLLKKKMKQVEKYHSTLHD
jgi:hypothetical protein